MKAAGLQIYGWDTSVNKRDFLFRLEFFEFRGNERVDPIHEIP
jgi:hypothetical protein